MTCCFVLLRKHQYNAQCLCVASVVESCAFSVNGCALSLPLALYIQRYCEVYIQEDVLLLFITRFRVVSKTEFQWMHVVEGRRETYGMCKKANIYSPCSFVFPVPSHLVRHTIHAHWHFQNTLDQTICVFPCGVWCVGQLYRPQKPFS
jgi:hypothetical protein